MPRLPYRPTYPKAVEVVKIQQELENRVKANAALAIEIPKLRKFIEATSQTAKTAAAGQVAALKKQLDAAEERLMGLQNNVGANEALLNTLRAQLAASQKTLHRDQVQYDLKMEEAIELRNHFLKWLPAKVGVARELAKHATPANIAAAKKLRKEVEDQLAPIRTGKTGLDPADMTAELLPLLNRCIADNKAFIDILKKGGI